MTNRTFTIPATVRDVSEFTASLGEALAPLPPEVEAAVVLGIQELCINIVRHAYAGAAGSIQFQIERSSDTLQFTIHDTGQNAYQPTREITAPDPLDLPESGMGLFIIHQTFDRVDYERLPDGNRWVLVKTL